MSSECQRLQLNWNWKATNVGRHRLTVDKESFSIESTKNCHDGAVNLLTIHKIKQKKQNIIRFQLHNVRKFIVFRVIYLFQCIPN